MSTARGMYACMYMCMHICMHVCMHVVKYVDMHISCERAFMHAGVHACMNRGSISKCARRCEDVQHLARRRDRMVMKKNMAEIPHVDIASSKKTTHYVIDDLKWRESCRETPEKSPKSGSPKKAHSYCNCLCGCQRE